MKNSWIIPAALFCIATVIFTDAAIMHYTNDNFLKSFFGILIAGISAASCISAIKN